MSADGAEVLERLQDFAGAEAAVEGGDAGGEFLVGEGDFGALGTSSRRWKWLSMTQKVTARTPVKSS